MALSPDAVLAAIKGLDIEHEVHTHAAVATVDAQVAALAGVDGVPVKNLFLKDKKHRYYICTALPESKVDLKVLSARMGLGKSGVSMAPETALQEILQVPLGSVSPLCIMNPSAAQVVLMLDARIQATPRIFVHPNLNTSSIALAPAALETIIKQYRPAVHYVDLTLDPKVDKDNPPDLKYLADEAEAGKAATGTADGPAAAAPAAAAKAAAAAAAAKKGGKKGASAAASSGSSGDGVGPRAALNTEELINKVAMALMGKTLKEAALDPYTVQRLQADVESQLNGIRNAAFASGYVAGKGEVVAYAQRKYA